MVLAGAVGSLSEGGAGEQSGPEADIEPLPYSIQDVVPRHSFNMLWDEKEHYMKKCAELLQCCVNMEKEMVIMSSTGGKSG